MTAITDSDHQSREVVDLLRDRIRCNALDLLTRVDASRARARADVGGEVLGDDGRPAIRDGSKPNRRPSPLSLEDDSDDGDVEDASDEEEKKDDCELMTSPCGGEISSANLGTPTELNKRLQQLVLQRRLDQVAGDAHNRLRIVQQSGGVITHFSVCNGDISDAKRGAAATTTFEDLRLPATLVRAVHEMGFDRPSPIQAATLPLILEGRSVIAQAHSGSGKTVAFSLGLLVRVLHADSGAANLENRTRALVVTPTRELAIQVLEQAIRPLSAHVPGFTAHLAISGSSSVAASPKATAATIASSPPPSACTAVSQPASSLEWAVATATPGSANRRGSAARLAGANARVVIGTPGKVTDMLKRRTLDVRSVRVLVLDEADSMVDSGFRAKTLQICKRLHPSAQRLFFSATFPPTVIDLASSLVKDPDLILVERDEELVLDVIKQLWVDVRSYPGGKIMFLADIYSLMTIGQSVVFVETRTEAEQVHATLSGAGYSVSILHSGMDAEDRDRTMQDFRRGASSVLIATNVVARGANVDSVCVVVNYSLPLDRDGNGDCETYLHRIGRTGRFGRKGTAINLINSESSLHVLEQISNHFGAPVTRVEADPEALANEVQI
jgi:ATP-dependent RNA helicase DDX19/DBP5